MAPTTIRFADEDLRDLQDRLRGTRWPEEETTPGRWDQGMPLRYAQDVAKEWETTYDWRATEDRINAYENVTVDVDGLSVHALHARSTHPQAQPLMLIHGWPGSIVEFLDIIPALTDPPEGHQAFHVVCPSLPGYGFSEKPAEAGWTLERMASALRDVMGHLGYERFLAHGNDWGSFICGILGARHSDAVRGIHLVMPMAGPPAESVDLSSRDQDRMVALQTFGAREGAYAAAMSTKPQSLAYGLVDSPVGLLGWVGEKYWSWSDHDGDAEVVIARQRILDLLTTMWLTKTGGSAGRLYWESYRNSALEHVSVPCAITVFPADGCMPKAWCEQRFTNLLFWEEAERGGHFPALEAPEKLVTDLRRFALEVGTRAGTTQLVGAL